MLSLTRFCAGWPVLLLLVPAGCKLLAAPHASRPAPSPGPTQTQHAEIPDTQVNATETAAPVVTPTSGLYSRCRAAPESLPGSTWIAFDAEWDGDSEIYAVRADGSSLTTLTENDIEDFLPVWSPNGQRLAFMSGSLIEMAYRLYIMNADGSGRMLVSGDLMGISDFTWSPDNHMLAFVGRKGGGALDLYVASFDGSSVRQITQNDGSWTLLATPSWSPVGDLVAFSAALDERFLVWRVYTVSTDDSLLRQLASEEAHNEDTPEWHPTADLLLFTSEDQSGLVSQLYTARSDGSSRKRLTFSEDRKGSYMWSPDGEMVAYEVIGDSHDPLPERTVDKIYVVSSDGSETCLVYTAEKWAKLAGWGPDSRHLAFTVSRGETWDLAVLDICDGSLRTIVKDVSGRYRASWKPQPPGD